MTDEVRLEAFSERLKGRKLYCIGSPALLPGLVRSRLAVIDSEVAQRGRRVLVTNNADPWLLRMKWDAVFVIKDNSDLRLAITYVTNCAKPVRLVWGSGEPSAQVYNHLARDGLTLIGLGTNVPASLEWDAIFWTHDTAADIIESALNGRVGPLTTEKYKVASVLKEIRASELGLVWSSIGESDKKGFLYWFDPSEGASQSNFTLQESAELLRSIADSLGR